MALKMNKIAAKGDSFSMVLSMAFSVNSAAGSGDNITVNGAAATDADFDDTDPAAPANGLNVHYQLNTAPSPDSISSHLLWTDYATTTIGSGSAITQTWDVGATDPVVAYTSGQIAWSGATTYLFSVAPTFSNITLGSVLFAGTAGLISQDNANFFWDDTLNRLGIGTATPGAPLDIQATGSSMKQTRWAPTAGSGAGIVIQRSRGATVGDDTIVVDGDHIAALNFRGYDGNDFTSQAVRISAFVDGTPGLDDMPGRLAFYTTADGSNSATERMRIDSSGNVGIGATPATSALLELSSTTGALLPTRMTTTQRDALTAVDGMILYNSTLSQVQGRIAAAWVDLGTGGADGVGYDEILEEASGLTKRAQINFIGSTVSCVDNGGATRTDCTFTTSGTGIENYETTFTTQTSITVTGATHGFGHRKIVPYCYDDASPKNSIEPSNITVDTSTFDVVITFEVSQTGTCTLAGWGGGGATIALDNLSSVAINLPLLPDAAAADDFGSATLPFKDLFFAGSSGTPGTNNFRITGASTSGTRVITAADGASVTVVADAGAANNFLTGITTAGAITKAQPACSDLSDGVTTCSDLTAGTPPFSAVTGTIAGGQYGAQTIDGDDIATSIPGNGLTMDTAATPDEIDCDTSSLTVVGCIEVATAAETTTGTDATRALSPDGLAGSTFGQVEIQADVIEQSTTITTGDNKWKFHIATGSKLIGMDLIDVIAAVGNTVSSSGAVTIDIARCAPVATGDPCSGTVADVLSTNLTIDVNEDSSDTAAADAVIDTALDDVIVDQHWRVDVDGAGTGAAGLTLTLIFQTP